MSCQRTGCKRAQKSQYLAQSCSFHAVRLRKEIQILASQKEQYMFFMRDHLCTLAGFLYFLDMETGCIQTCCESHHLHIKYGCYFPLLFFFVIQPHSSVSITGGVIGHLLQFHKNRKLSTKHS